MRSRVLYCAAWMGAAGAAVFVATGLAAEASGSTPSCPTGQASSVESKQSDVKQPIFHASPPAAQEDLLFDPVDQRKFVFRFDDSHTPQSHEIPIQVGYPHKAPRDGLNVDDGLNARLGGGEELEGPNGRTIASAQVLKHLRRVSEHKIGLCVGLNPADLAVPPGSYSGIVGIAYSDTMLAPVDIEVSFRATAAKAAIIAFLGVFLGLVVKALSEAAVIARTTGVGSRRALLTYLSQLMFPVTLILAGVSGVFAYVTLYSEDRDWGADGQDGLRLFATCFVLQMGTSEILAVLNRFGGGGGSPGPPATPAS